MNQTEFDDLADQILLLVEDTIYDSGVDIDCENSGGVLTLTCENNGSKIIVSRQPANFEIWVAARSGGFHLAYDGGFWKCAVTGETLGELLKRVCLEQSGEALEFNL